VATPRHQRRDSGKHGQSARETHQAMLSWPDPPAATGRDLPFC
jgi:hypothetical protein